MKGRLLLILMILAPWTGGIVYLVHPNQPAIQHRMGIVSSPQMNWHQQYLILLRG